MIRKPSSRLLCALFASLALLALTASGARAGTLDQVRAAGAIRLGYSPSAAPFAFAGDDRKPLGYSVELCLAVVEAVKLRLNLPALKVQWVSLKAEERLAAVRSRRIDLECGTASQTLARRAEVDFSLPIFIDGAAMAVRVLSDVRRLADLDGGGVAVIPGTTTEKLLLSALQRDGIDAEVQRVANQEDGIAALRSGDVDAFVTDRSLLLGALVDRGVQGDFLIPQELLSYELYGLMLRRGDADFRLVVDGALAELYRSGRIYEIYDRWLGRIGQPDIGLRQLYRLNALP